MCKFVIYHNPKCSRSRAALNYLLDKTKQLEIRKYMTDAFSFDELQDLLQKLNLRPFQLVRTKDELYKNQFKTIELSDMAWIETMLQYPQLIRRPIVVCNDMAVIAEVPDNIDKIISI